MIAVGKPDIGQAEIDNVMAVMCSRWITQGEWVAKFEAAFADYVGAKYAVAVSSGTAALHLAMVALGIGPGDEVIVPALTFIATANAVAYTGATPVVVDVDPLTWNLDPVAVVKATTPQTRAIIPVHLYGVPCEMDRLRHVARAAAAYYSDELLNPPDIYIVEDCAEAIGAKINEQHVGTFGEMGCFSFYGNKTITTGEGGMVVTDDDALAETLRKLRGQGQTQHRYWHDVVGFNYRMTDIQAAVGCAQLERLPEFLEKRQQVWAWYSHYLPDGVTMQTPPRKQGGENGHWAMAVKLPTNINRWTLRKILEGKGIETRPVFFPVNDMEMYFYDGNRQAAHISLNGLVLPMHTGLFENDVKFICKTLSEAIERQHDRREDAEQYGFAQESIRYPRADARRWDSFASYPSVD